MAEVQYIVYAPQKYVSVQTAWDTENVIKM